MDIYVTKRNGKKEKFEIRKILNWELWAINDLKKYINWQEIAISITNYLYDGINTQEIQLKLIEELNRRKTWYHSIAAGKLYAAYIRKKIFDDINPPSVKELHNKLIEKGIMIKLNYNDEEYSIIEKIIDHRKDFELSYGQIYQLVNKYALSNRINKTPYETPQFIFMRMAMALAEDEDNKLEKVFKFYKYLSEGKINAPTPNYLNLGTSKNGFISCCLITSKDTAESINVAYYASYSMTNSSAGVGSYLNIRSINNGVRNGLIKHSGKLPYFKALASIVNSTSQGGRGGSITQHATIYDPEIYDILYLQNPRTPIQKQNRSSHFSIMFNSFFVEKVYKNENIFTFNSYTAPDLQEAFFKGNYKNFKLLYEKYENDPKFKRNYINARDLILTALRQAHEVATVYFINIDEVNKHTPFKETIYQSNLCQEIVQPTKPYEKVTDLYEDNNEKLGEISLCALGGISVSLIENDEEYEDVAYYTLLMIDKCIHKNHYVFPHLEYTAKSRLNAGVGIVGLAHELAKKNLKYNSIEGLKHIHFIAERHLYYLIKASLRLGKEKGNAPWIYKTKWPEGWLPIDTYNKEVDTIANFEYKYNWEKLRKEIIDNKGIRNSVLVAHMPTESSSKTTGLPNGIYPIRGIYLLKTDANNTIDYIAKDSDILKDNYQLAWELSVEDQIKFYSVIQKFTDQAISADIYSNRRDNIELRASRLLDEFFYMYKYGLKTRYYTNSLTTKGLELNTTDNIYNITKENNYKEKGCSGGFCTI